MPLTPPRDGERIARLERAQIVVSALAGGDDAAACLERSLTAAWPSTSKPGFHRCPVTAAERSPSMTLSQIDDVNGVADDGAVQQEAVKEAL
jgi:hypothetical protein